ncbi:MAG: hypothetical protein ABSB76_40910 [Streptosporangiaceae bacterium]
MLLSPTALPPDILPGDRFVLGSTVGSITYHAGVLRQRRDWTGDRTAPGA